jgi:hypothetical protein
VVGSSFAQAASARERDWQPQRTWVYVVGLLKFENRDVFNSFPQTNRRDAQLVDFFRQQGVPEDHIVFLKDGQATSRRVQNSFPRFWPKHSPVTCSSSITPGTVTNQTMNELRICHLRCR